MAHKHPRLRKLADPCRKRDDRRTVARSDVPGGEREPVARRNGDAFVRHAEVRCRHVGARPMGCRRSPSRVEPRSTGIRVQSRAIDRRGAHDGVDPTCASASEDGRVCKQCHRDWGEQKAGESDGRANVRAASAIAMNTASALSAPSNAAIAARRPGRRRGYANTAMPKRRVARRAGRCCRSSPCPAAAPPARRRSRAGR